jgi:electron transfer flavoprotein alpha subunit
MTDKLEHMLKPGGVWVFVEQDSGLINSVSWELLGEGKKLAADSGSLLTAVLMGYGIREAAPEVFAYGADALVVVDNPSLEQYRTQPYTKVLADLIRKHEPDILLLGATTIGRDLASPVATELGTGLTADCTGLEIDEETNLLKQTRPAFGGNVMATIVCHDSRPQMATVRPRVFATPIPESGRYGVVIEESATLSENEIPTKILDFINDIEQETVEIEKAEVLVCTGRGIGSARNLPMIKELASLLHGEVAGSRPVIEMGLLPPSCQVGQTGKTVRPALYIAAGVSGAIQHVAGMKDSDTIIAINDDSEAPIFKIATYGIVGDLRKIIPAVINEIKKRTGIEDHKEDLASNAS